MYYKSRIRPSKPLNVDGYKLHQELWSLFPGVKRGESRFLYRVGQDCVYAVSDIQPIDTTGRWLVNPTVPYNPQVFKGLVLDFMLKVNPVYDQFEDGKKVRHSIILEYIHKLRRSGKPQSEWPCAEDIRLKACSEWFKTQEDLKGFSVNNFRVEQQQDVQFENERTGDTMKFTVLDLRGQLTVLDPDAFKHTLYHGIGKAKRFGYGMFMIKAA